MNKRTVSALEDLVLSLEATARGYEQHIDKLEADNKILIEALEDVYMNTLPERKASLEIRIDVIRVDAETALEKVRGEK